jgi:hypothetical protein
MNSALPECDWVYFATPARGSFTVTAEFASEAKVIIRNVYNSDGIRIANVANVEPGHKILLAYGGQGNQYKPLFCCTAKLAANPVRSSRHSFDVFTYVDDSLIDRLRDSDYTPDPVVQRFVGMSIGDMRAIYAIYRARSGGLPETTRCGGGRKYSSEPSPPLSQARQTR